jgi:predicted nucleic acid-binding Zn ribbon protein
MTAIANASATWYRRTSDHDATTSSNRNDPAVVGGGSSALQTPRRETMPVTIRACPVCQDTFHPAGRQLYCGNSCRQIAFRRRQRRTPIVVPRPAQTRDVTCYQCPECEALFLGTQRCDDCGVFCRRVGLAGSCPHCDEVVTVQDLLNLPDAAVIDSNLGAR